MVVLMRAGLQLKSVGRQRVAEADVLEADGLREVYDLHSARFLLDFLGMLQIFEDLL